MNDNISNPPASPAPTWASSFLPAADRVLYPLTLGITAVVWGFEVYEFWRGGGFRARYSFAEGYLAVLTAYAASRESSKWLGVEASTVILRRGEIFVALWVSSWLAMTAIANLNTRFVLPEDLMKVTLGVLGIFVVSGVSSGVRERATRRGAGSGEAGSSRSKLDAVASERKEEALRLLSARESITAGEAAAALNVSLPTSWRLLEALEKEGLVSQTPSDNPAERRYTLRKR